MPHPNDLNSDKQSFPSRILLWIHSMEGGGAERQLVCLADELASRDGVQVTLGTLAPVSSDRYVISKRVRRVGLDLYQSGGGLIRGSWQNWSRIRSLRSLAQQEKAELIISFCDTNNILALAAMGGRIPVIISERNDPRKQILSRRWEILRSWFYPQASLCVSQTSDVSAYLRSRYFSKMNEADCGGRKRVATIPSAIIPPFQFAFNSSGAERFCQIMESRENESAGIKRLLYVGRLSKQKRVDRLLKAFAQLSNDFPEWKLRIVGEGELLNELRALEKEICSPGSVEWVGWCSDMGKEYEIANGFTLASDYEGFPQTLIEAMTAGLPLVVTRCTSAMQEALGDAMSNAIAESDEAYVSKLREMMGSSARRVQIGMQARARAEEFQWEKVSARWIEAIQNVWTSRPR